MARAIDILLCFSAARPVWTLSGLSARLGLGKSTVHRLLQDLVLRGLIRTDPPARGLRLGLKVFELGQLAQRELDLRRLARPVMEELARKTGETVALSVLDGGDALCIELIDGWHEIQLVTRLGRRVPLHAGSLARILLASLPETEIDRYLARRRLARLGPRTITDPARLRRALAAARARGYTFSVEETSAGAAGLGAPVRDHRGRVVASLSVLGPRARLEGPGRARLLRQLLDAAGAVSARLGAP